MTTTIDHIGINVADFAKSKKLYVAALKPLGLSVVSDYGNVIGMGVEQPYLWISEGTPGHVHVALLADTRKEVDEFYKAAIKAGAKDNGKPGVRTEYSNNYYAAYVLDIDGHNIEAVTYAP